MEDEGKTDEMESGRIEEMSEVEPSWLGFMIVASVGERVDVKGEGVDADRSLEKM